MIYVTIEDKLYTVNKRVFEKYRKAMKEVEKPDSDIDREEVLKLIEREGRLKGRITDMYNY
jgi:hypothetical protein